MSSPDLPPPPPSYADTEQQSLNSYLATDPKYRAQAVKNTLGSYIGRDNPAASSQEYLKMQNDIDALTARRIALENQKADNFANGWMDANQLNKMTTDLASVINQQSVAQRNLEQYRKDNKIMDQNNIGDIDIARAYGTASLDFADEQAKRQLSLREQLGVRNVEQARKELIASDPEGYARRMALGKQIDQQLATNDDGTVNYLRDKARADYDIGPDGNLVFLRDEARKKIDNIGTSVNARMLSDTLADYGLGSKLDDVTRSQVEQNARAGQAARGNILGNAAAYGEAMEVGAAGEARKQQRLQNLGAVNTDYNNYEAGLGTQLAGYTGAVNADKDRLTNNLSIADNAIYGRKQQSIANNQSVMLGAPLSAQFSTLGGAGTGSVAYNPAIGNQGATVQNGNAGTQYQLGAYNTMSSNANQAAAAGNPWMNMGMGIVGAGAGAFTGGVGAGLASSMFTAAGTKKAA